MVGGLVGCLSVHAQIMTVNMNINGSLKLSVVISWKLIGCLDGWWFGWLFQRADHDCQHECQWKDEAWLRHFEEVSWMVGGWLFQRARANHARQLAIYSPKFNIAKTQRD